MTTSSIKSINVIANQATTGTGTLREKVWTTKLADAINSETLTISESNEVLDFVFDSKEYSIPVNALALKALQPAFSTDTVEDELNRLKNAYISDQQARFSGSTVSTTALPEKAVITADDYRLNAIKLNLFKPDVAVELATLDEEVNSITDKTTKPDLLKIIERYKALFITDEQRETYNIKLEKEQEFQAKFKAITDLGYTDIKPLTDSIYMAELDPALVKTKLKELTDLGYLITKSEFVMERGIIAVSFKELKKVSETA
jgi:hypothetical protein